MDEGGSRSVRVLHADDDRSFRELIVDLLETVDDIEIVSVATAKEAQTRLDEEEFDCVLSDYDAEETGAFRQVIEATAEGPPCILLTGEERDQIDADTSAAVDDYLRKGVGGQFRSLPERIRSHVDRYRSVERYRALFEEGGGPMVVHDAETGEIIDVNSQYADMLEYDREQAEAMDITDIAPGEEPYTPERAMERLEAAANGEPQTFEWMNVTAHGDRIPVEVTLKRMDVAGAGRVLATIRDISERKRREAALERHKGHLEQLHNAATRLLAAEDREEVYESVLDTAESVLDPELCAVVIREGNQLSPVAVGGSDTNALADPLPITESPEWAAIETGETKSYQTDSGTMLYLPLEGHGVLSLRGYAPDTAHARELGETLASHAAVALDRADREAQLVERSRRRESLAAAYPDYVFFIDADGVYQEVWLTPEHEVKGGRPESEIEGKTVDDLLDDTAAATINEALDEALSTGEIQEVEYCLTLRGPPSWYEARIAPLPADGDTPEVVLVARNITTQHQYEQRLEAQNERLDKFASMVSHDLRNPLNVVQGRLELIEDAADRDAVVEHATAAGSAATRMNDLIDDMLTMARTDEQELTVGSVSILAAATRAWSAVAEPDATIDVQVTDADRISADESELIRLFENLFRNSVEHAGADTTVAVETLEDGFAVTDDGPGIDEQHRDEVFESGYSTTDGSTGFGLHIVEQIAEAHGWSISLGEHENGARFEVTGVEFVDRAG